MVQSVVPKMNPVEELDMQRILIKSDARGDSLTIKALLEAQLPYEVMLAYSHLEMESLLRERQFHLLILQTGATLPRDFQYVQSIRLREYREPILLITESLGNLTTDTFADKYNAYFLEKRSLESTIVGLTQKLMVLKTTSQQIHRRYPTDEFATLESLGSSERIDSKMYNLSVGGAYFEISGRPDLRVGELMRVTVALNSMSREHQLHGRVVWTTPRGHVNGDFGIGVHFIRPTDLASDSPSSGQE